MYRELYIESQEWIYISSREEEKIVDIVEEKRKQEKREISSLTRTGFLAQKRAIRSRVSALSLSEKVQTSCLDTSLRSRCIRDALNVCLRTWKRDVAFLLARDHVLSLIRREDKQLAKVCWNNLFTEMSSFALSASHPAENQGLTRNVLADVIWSVHMCLCKNVSLSMERALLSPELDLLEGCIFALLDPLLFFWNKTSNNVSNKALFNLPELWKREEEERRKNLVIDATYTSQRETPQDCLLEKSVLEERKAILEKTLKFKTL